MTSTALQIDLHGLDAIRRRVEVLGQMDLSPAEAELAATVESQTRRRLGSEKRAPDGSAWPEWRGNYVGVKMLERSGALIDSIQVLDASDHYEVGSDLVYAAIHQFGGAEVGIDLPAREYLGISEDNEAELAEVLDAWVERQVAR